MTAYFSLLYFSVQKCSC